jgi:hypothetical protein
MLIPDGGNYRRTPSSAPVPASKIDNRSADKIERDAIPSRAGSGPATNPQLQAASKNTRDKLNQGQAAKENLAHLQQLPPQRRKNLQGEIEQARKEAGSSNKAAQDAVSGEVQLAKRLLSPAHFESYTQALQRQYDDHPDQLKNVKTGLVQANSATTPTAEAKKSAVSQKLDEANKAQQEADALAMGGTHSASYTRYVVEPARQKAAAAWQAVRAEVEKELTVAAEKGPDAPRQGANYDPAAAKAAELSALASNNPQFQDAIVQAQENVAAKATAQEVERVYQKDGAQAAAATLKNLTGNSTASQSEKLIDLSKSTIDKISQDLAKEKDTGKLKNTVTDLSIAAGKGGPNATQAIAQSLANAFDDKGVNTGAVGSGKGGSHAVYSYLLDDAFKGAIGNGANPVLAIATADALSAAGKTAGADKVNQAVIDGVQDARKKYDDAQQKYAQLEQELQTDLNNLGPALTDKERADYTTAFWEDSTRPTDEQHKDDLSHAEIRANAKTAGDQFANTLANATPRLEQLALNGNKDAANALLQGNEKLAKDPAHAQQSLEWTTRVGNDSSLFNAIDKATDKNLTERIRDGIATDAVASMAGKLAADAANGSDPSNLEKGYDQFKRALSDFGKAKAFVGLKGEIDDAIKHVSELRKTVKALEALGVDNPDKLIRQRQAQKEAEALLTGWGEKSKFGKALAGAGLAVGIIDAGKNFKDGKVFEGIIGSIGSAKTVTEIGIGVLGVWAQAGKYGVTKDFAEGASKFGAKYLPFVGLALDAVQFKGDIDSLRSNPNAGEVLSIIGTTISLIGDIPETVPIVGTAVGGALGAIGSLISGIGGFIDTLIEGNQALDARRNRELKYLTLALCNEGTAKNLVDHQHDINFLENLQLKPEAIRSIVNESSAKPDYAQKMLQTLVSTAAIFGLKGEAAEKFIHQGLSLTNEQAAKATADFPVTDLAKFDQLLNSTGAERLRIVNELRQERLDWVKSNLPDLYNSYFANHQAPYDQVNLGYFDDWLNAKTKPDPQLGGISRGYEPIA